MLERKGADYESAKIATIGRIDQEFLGGLPFGEDLSGSVRDLTTHPDNMTLLHNTALAKSASIESENQTVF